MKIRYRLREIRTAKKMKYKELSNLTKIQERMIVRIEKNEVNATLKTLIKLAKALAVEVNELYEVEDEENIEK